MQGTVIGVAAVGDAVAAGKAVVVIESMKIECPVETEMSGTVSSVLVRVGAVVQEGDVLVVVDEAEAGTTAPAPPDETGAESSSRADLDAVLQRHARLLDDARPDAVAQRRRTGGARDACGR